jgi:hypothetical protein
LPCCSIPIINAMVVLRWVEGLRLRKPTPQNYSTTCQLTKSCSTASSRLMLDSSALRGRGKNPAMKSKASKFEYLDYSQQLQRLVQQTGRQMRCAARNHPINVLKLSAGSGVAHMETSPRRSQVAFAPSRRLTLPIRLNSNGALFGRVSSPAIPSGPVSSGFSPNRIQFYGARRVLDRQITLRRSGISGTATVCPRVRFDHGCRRAR